MSHIEITRAERIEMEVLLYEMRGAFSELHEDWGEDRARIFQAIRALIVAPETHN